MRFEILRASDIMGDKCPIEGAVEVGGDWFIEVATLEDLLALRERCKQDLILTRGNLDRHDKIWIYDDYME